jgi:hypothetical protein
MMSMPQVSMKYPSASSARAMARRYRKNSCGPRRGFVGSEVKYVDTSVLGVGLDTTGSINHLNIIPQGTTVNTRLGKSCRVTGFRVNGFIEAQSSATSNIVELVYVWDYQPNKALPAITDIFDAVTPLQNKRMENSERFKIVKSFKYVLEGAPGQPESGVPINAYVKIKNGISLYTNADTTGVIGNLVEGALLCITRGNKVSGTTAASFNGYHRIFFSDKTA